MRAYLPAYELRVPRNTADALALLDTEPGAWRPFAGGTDLMVLLEFGQLPHKQFLSIWKLPELRGIDVTPEHVTLGGLTTYSEVQRNGILQREFPLLCRAAAETGSVAIQNRGTLGGNIVNASPAADSPPALLVYDAELELLSARGARWVPYRTFHTGYRTTVLASNELVSRIRLPRFRSEWRQFYRKVGTRKAQAISKVCFAAASRMENGRVADVRIALGSVAPVPLRCVQTEAAVRDGRDALAELAKEISPIDDFRSTARYRTRVAQNLLREFLDSRLTNSML
jgi:CO/xanthine dehydrogenase FAD-binding subunit